MHPVLRVHVTLCFRFTRRNMLVAHIDRQRLLASSIAAFANIPDSLLGRNIAIVCVD
jgi:hypothetical protein